MGIDFLSNFLIDWQTIGVFKKIGAPRKPAKPNQTRPNWLCLFFFFFMVQNGLEVVQTARFVVYTVGGSVLNRIAQENIKNILKKYKKIFL